MFDNCFLLPPVTPTAQILCGIAIFALFANCRLQRVLHPHRCANRQRPFDVAHKCDAGCHSVHIVLRALLFMRWNANAPMRVGFVRERRKYGKNMTAMWAACNSKYFVIWKRRTRWRHTLDWTLMTRAFDTFDTENDARNADENVIKCNMMFFVRISRSLSLCMQIFSASMWMRVRRTFAGQVCAVLMGGACWRRCVVAESNFN